MRTTITQEVHNLTEEETQTVVDDMLSRFDEEAKTAGLLNGGVEETIGYAPEVTIVNHAPDSELVYVVYESEDSQNEPAPDI